VCPSAGPEGLYCSSRAFGRVSPPIRRPLLVTFPLEKHPKVTFTVYMPWYMPPYVASRRCTCLPVTPVGRATCSLSVTFPLEKRHKVSIVLGPYMLCVRIVFFVDGGPWPPRLYFSVQSEKYQKTWSAYERSIL